MSGRPALNSDTPPPRLLVLERRGREVQEDGGASEASDRRSRAVQEDRSEGEAREADDGGASEALHGDGDGDSLFEVFEVLAVADGIVRVRSAYLFELGEELAVRIEHAGSVSDATARVRGHAGPSEDRITELEILDRSAPRAS